MSDQTHHLLESLRLRLRHAARRITMAELAYGAVLVLGVLVGAWLLAAGLEAGLWLDPLPRTVLAGATGLALITLLAYFVGRPLLDLLGVTGGPSEESVARRIGDHHPEVADRLVNLLDLSEGRGSHAPSTLVERAVRMLGEDVQDVSFDDVEDFGQARRVSRLAAVPALALIAVLLAAPSTFLGATQRLLAPAEHFAKPLPFTLDVTPGSVELVKGDSLQVRVRPQGRELPRSVTLQLNNVDEEHVEEVTLTAGDDGVFEHTLVNVRTPLRYRAHAAPVAGDWHRVELTERPVLRDLRVTLDFPAYTGMPDQRLAPNVGDVTALPGTRVHVRAGLGGPAVDEALLVFGDDRRDTLQVDASAGAAAAEGTFTLQREGQYHVRLRTTDGIANRAPIRYTLQLVRDEAPSVTLLAPQEETALDESMRAGLRVRLSDDFGFRRLQLHYRLSESRFKDAMEDYAALDLPLEAPRQLDQEVIYDWLLNETTDLNLAPGDVVDYYVKVWDNDAVAGFKTAETPVHRLTLPSLAEQYEQLDRGQDDTQEQLEEMTRESERMREQFEELRDELRRKPEASWEDERQVERLREQQERLQEQADEITRRIEESTEQMRRNDMVGEETLELYEELQRVADEVRSPELEQALQQLQESLQNMDPQMMQEALEDFQFNEQQYQQRLERTLELFKKARVQQRLEEAARRADELARQERELAEATEQLRRDQGEDVGDPNERPSSESDDTANDDAEEERAASPDDARSQQGERASGDEAEQQENTGAQDEASSEGDESGQSSREDASSEDQANQAGGSEQEDAARREQLAEQQRRASEEMEALEEHIREMGEQMNELRSSPQQEMERLRRQMDQQQLSRQMQQNSEQLQQNQLQPAQEGQQRMEQQLQQMQEMMSQMQQGMQGQQMQMNVAGLRRALTDVLTLSEQQESLRNNVRDAASDNPSLRTFARRQTELSEGLSTVADTLQKLSKDIPQMRREVQQEAGESLRAMSTATEAMTDRRAGQAAGYQKTSMMHLNELALMLSELMSNLQQNAGSGSGSGMSMQQMMEQMQQMSGQQQQLNEQIQQMLNDMQGNRLSTDQQQRLEQMARQQQQIRQQMQELSRNRNAKGEMLGDLQQIAREMEETIKEMQERQVGRRTIDRQRQILTRMLQAQKSLRTQGEQEQREGQTGSEYDRERPGELTPQEESDRLRRALIRAIESDYAPDYEELIRRYFDLLQQQQDAAPEEE